MRSIKRCGHCSPSQPFRIGLWSVSSLPVLKSFFDALLPSKIHLDGQPPVILLRCALTASKGRRRPTFCKERNPGGQFCNCCNTLGPFLMCLFERKSEILLHIQGIVERPCDSRHLALASYRTIDAFASLTYKACTGTDTEVPETRLRAILQKTTLQRDSYCDNLPETFGIMYSYGPFLFQPIDAVRSNEGRTACKHTQERHTQERKKKHRGKVHAYLC